MIQDSSTTPLVNFRFFGNLEAEILVVCEPNNGTEDLPMSASSMKTFIEAAIDAGLTKKEFCYLELCNVFPEEAKKSDSKEAAFLKPIIEAYKQLDLSKYKVILPLGKQAARTVYGRAVKITSIRGTPDFGETFIFPMLSPAYTIKNLDQKPIFDTDFHTFVTYKNNNYKPIERPNLNYYWCEDLSDFLNSKPDLVAFDTETTGLRQPNFTPEIITFQFCKKAGEVAVCPVHPLFWDWESEEKRLKLVRHIKTLLADPTIKKVAHNLQYDWHVSLDNGYEVNGAHACTELMAWAVDENMMSKSIDNVVRRFIPSMAGFNDYYNETIDKSNMLSVPKDDFLMYAGGDADCAFQIYQILDEKLKKEPSHRRGFYRIKMPCLKLLFKIERTGIPVNRDYLNNLKTLFRKELNSLYDELISMVPKKVLHAHNTKDKGLKFTRDRFVVDILFSEDGFNLKPRVFTKGSSLTDTPIPSVSAKDHLPYFVNEPGTPGVFINKYMSYVKLEKLLSTYTDTFDKYIYEDSRVRSDYRLSRTNTGRTSSSGPNSQNYPSRGPWASPYKDMFQAPEGYSFVTCDASQIELRLVAHASQDPVLLDIYRNDRDVHATTAAACLGLNSNDWDNLPKEEKKLQRFRAKAVNFGFLYSMWWPKFKIYAKTEYGLDYTDQEAEYLYDTFFRTYPRLRRWHKRTKDFATEHGYIKSPMGFIRHLPRVWSSDIATQKEALRQAINAPIQGDASNLGLLALARVANQDTDNKILPMGFIHDDCLMLVKEGFEQDAVDAVVYAMNQHKLEKVCGLHLTVPIKGEPDVGKSLGSMYELTGVPNDAPEWVKKIKLPKLLDAKKPSWWDDKKDF